MSFVYFYSNLHLDLRIFIFGGKKLSFFTFPSFCTFLSLEKKTEKFINMKLSTLLHGMQGGRQFCCLVLVFQRLDGHTKQTLKISLFRSNTVNIGVQSNLYIFKTLNEAIT